MFAGCFLSCFNNHHITVSYICVLVTETTEQICSEFRRRTSLSPELTLLTSGVDPDGGTDPGFFFSHSL